MKSLAFDSRLYTSVAVAKAVADYSEAADLSLTETPEALTVRIAAIKVDVDPEKFEGEFSNYVLGLMQI